MEDEKWGIFEFDNRGKQQLYDGPYCSRGQAEREIDRLVSRDGLESWASDLAVGIYLPEKKLETHD
jgi:hypothetical protein